MRGRKKGSNRVTGMKVPWAQGGDPSPREVLINSRIVMPAKAGIQKKQRNYSGASRGMGGLPWKAKTKDLKMSADCFRKVER